MNSTIEYYNNNAEAFAAETINADMSYCLERFLKYLEPGSRVLDAGCGSGRDTIAFMENGYVVDAFDASEEICRLASEKTGIEVKCLRFEDLSGSDEYDGIWACASLLHVRKKDLPGVFHKLNELLMAGGILYASFKYGTGEREKNGRFFTDMTEPELVSLVTSEGMDILELFRTKDVRPGRTNEEWVNVIAKGI